MKKSRPKRQAIRQNDQGFACYFLFPRDKIFFFRDRVKGTGGSDSLWGVGMRHKKENVYNKTFKKDDYKTQTVKIF